MVNDISKFRNGSRYQEPNPGSFCRQSGSRPTLPSPTGTTGETCERISQREQSRDRRLTFVWRSSCQTPAAAPPPDSSSRTRPPPVA